MVSFEGGKDMYYNSRWLEKKMGSYLPVDPSQKKPQLEYVSEDSCLAQIYKKITSLIDSGEWTVKDYRQFRREIAVYPLPEMNVIGNFFLYLLSVPQESFSETITFLNDLFQLHILDERVKITETNPETKEEKTYYKIQTRPVKKTDVIRVPMAIQSMISSTFHFASIESLLDENYPEDPRGRMERLVEFFEEECKRGGPLEDAFKEFLFASFSFVKDKTLLNQFVCEEIKFQFEMIRKAIEQMIQKETYKANRAYNRYRSSVLENYYLSQAKENSRRPKRYSSHFD